MNLYDKDDGFKGFTLQQANALLPDIIAITEKTMAKLEKSKHTLYESATDAKIHIENTKIMTEWSQKIVELGVYPKGYFTVDFKSKIPDTLLCWTYGENTITYTHKIHENFKDRVSIRNEDYIGFENSMN